MNINLLLLALIIIQFANAQTKETTITGNQPTDSSTNLITFPRVDRITLNLGVGVETSGFGLNTTWNYSNRLVCLPVWVISLHMLDLPLALN